jgi:tetratricopeptide (TPR) repeat protein
LKLGDQARATPFALQAAHKAIQGPSASAREKPGWYFDYTGQLGQISAVLADLGAYDEAIAVVQPIDSNNRAQFYAHTVNAAIRKLDAAGVERMLPIAIEAFRGDSTPNHMIQLRLLSGLTRALAVAGYRDDALKAFQEFLDVLGNSSSNEQIRQKNLLSAVMQADGGDIRGALASADKSGLMIENPSDAQIAMLVAMRLRLQGAAEFEEAKREAMKILPSVSGPKAEVLSAIVVHLAKKGNIEPALQTLAILDVESGDAVKGVHDSAASVLAEAQEKLGDLRGSFATALRIRQATVRWPVLLKLAGTQPTR